MSLRIDIVHIGSLSRNPYWNEKAAKRPAAATITLITDDERLILVDPGLPPELMVAALDQRTGKTPDDIDLIFVTNRREAHRRGLGAFPGVKAYMFERELDDWAGDRLDPAPRELLERLTPAPERLTDRVHIFPTPGPTIGHCSLLLLGATGNMMITGDAVLTRDHYEHGAIYDRCMDRETAKESLAEIVELADVIVPGHDNFFVARGAGMF